ncbi:MAG TPA: methionyl-tRNA formyltransferase [Candidatus Megaira endosymbiont of Nemacystus decipiens]|nr:methionyl-tRNA formyltransferase [Candidatus Megaera endosymbiont of Nemacystus decipiens]
MNVIFMGTPDFAVPPLKKLIDSKEHDVKAVFTKEPKRQNRGMKLVYSPVHKVAMENNIEIHTPKTLRKDNVLDLIKSINADVIVVAAYGLIVPENILKAKKFGCINIHPSDLPKYRGAAPLQRIIINNEKDSAVCIIQMDEGVDTGDILMKQDFEISPESTFREFHDQCAEIGSDLLIKVLDNITTITPKKQSSEGATYANKLTKEEGKIKWSSETAEQIHCKIKGMNPWPGVYCYENDDESNMIKIIESSFKVENHNYESGSVISNKFDVACLGGILRLIKVKPEGKKEMSGEDFLRGKSIKKLY